MFDQRAHVAEDERIERAALREALRRELFDFDAIQKHVRPSVLFLIREPPKRDKNNLNAAYAFQ